MPSVIVNVYINRRRRGENEVKCAEFVELNSGVALIGFAGKCAAHSLVVHRQAIFLCKFSVLAPV